MKRISLLLLILVSFCFSGEDLNWNGWEDTVAISSTLAVGTTYYTKAFALSRYDNIKLMVKCNDTTNAGFAGDSVNFGYGFQTGVETENSSGLRDTAWMEEDRFDIDTMVVDSFGVGSKGYVGADGTLNRFWNNASDTSSVTGFAIQRRQFSPEWDVLIRFYILPITGNLTGSPLNLIFQVDQRKHQPVKMQ